MTMDQRRRSWLGKEVLRLATSVLTCSSNGTTAAPTPLTGKQGGREEIRTYYTIISKSTLTPVSLAHTRHYHLVLNARGYKAPCSLPYYRMMEQVNNVRMEVSLL